ncbi:hypothetical protein S40285_09636 [Stachybotrys chlorohalonatus IBT 40285]|uniref:FAD-binding PCMH-type domain-containing protein n=1 Tax=Stachybotrys chlorohalonatus (strain IBT 40285) TaxID=1283841 RepID=A0A084Q862_STAC4|nr:hypothetical protein S40285_09636 [Stachybotrys chlorohalonata IBT 40285]
MAFQIQDLHCMQYARDAPGPENMDYKFFNNQYATSSYQEEHDMNPSLIVQPKGDEDIIKTIKYAKGNRIAIAVKSGGHQYSGASSTGGKNIQIDLTNTYRDMMLLPEKTTTPDATAYVKIGVSNQLQDLIAYLSEHGLFVPTGQCAYVCAGGHGQTGGYGQLGRSFGLFGDYIRSIRMIDHDGQVQSSITKENPETKGLFYAILGGSPGNFGIITHYTVEVMRGSYYKGTIPGPNNIKGPAALKGLWLWRKEVLVKLLTAIATMAEDPTFPRGFDLCVSVFSKDSSVVPLLFPEVNSPFIQDLVKAFLGEFADEVSAFLNGSFPVIILYAQWCPTSPDDKYDKNVDKWFQQFRDLNNKKKYWCLTVNEFSDKDKIPGSNKTWDMSSIAGQWLFPERREYNLPYIKRIHSSNSTNFKSKINGMSWAEHVAGRLDLVYNPNHIKDKKNTDQYELYKHCKLSVQIQHFGGKNSKLHQNKDNGTSYSWRDSTIVQVLDCFHDEGNDGRGVSYRDLAVKYQADNDAVFLGESGCFSSEDRRMLWGSYGDWDLGNPKIWKRYYDDEEKYQRLGKARGKADPNGTFTPNPFAVTAVKD